MRVRCPHCQVPVDYLPEEETAESLTCPSCLSVISVDSGDETISVEPGNGEMIAHYLLKETLGVGSFGSVHAALDTQLDRSVAIKLPRYDGMSEKYLKQFFREARAAAQVRHQNIVAVHEIGQEPNGGRVYIVSDLIDGISLKDAIRLKQEREEITEPREAATMIATILDAIQAAHDVGVIHRDLKPANVLLDRDDQPYVTDFGLAKREAELTVTAKGDVIGTPAYMSPEQAGGDGYRADRRSDVYSLGVMLYEMLVGRKPFEGTKSRLLLHQILKDDPVAPRKRNSAVPRDLETICIKAMEKEPDRRYQTAGDMAADLRRHLNGEPITARPISSLERSWRWAKRNRALATSIVIASALLCGLVAMAVFRPDPETVTEFVPTPEATMKIRVVTDPPGAEIALVPVNPHGRFPVEQDRIRPEGTTPLTLEVPPGEYLVVARKDDLFHEVYRTVPLNKESRLGSHPHMRWSFQDDGALLPSIRLFRNIKGWRLVSGGAFTMGKDPVYNTPPHERTVSDLYVQPNEFTIGEFRETGLKFPPPLDNHWELDAAVPMTEVGWNVAVASAELFGGRLPTEIEYEYMATNGGRTEFPWGNDSERITSWKLDVVGHVDYDVTESGIRGMFSNVAEWTDSSWYAYPGATEVSDAQKPLSVFERMVRSGDGRVAEGEVPDVTKVGNYARSRRLQRSTSETTAGLGFRCVRSAKPRFLD